MAGYSTWRHSLFAVGCLKHPTVRDGVIIAFTTVWGSVYGVRSTEYSGMHASERIYQMMMAFCMLHKFRVTTTVATVINIITAEDSVAAVCEICRMYGNHPCSAVHHATPPKPVGLEWLFMIEGLLCTEYRKESLSGSARQSLHLFLFRSFIPLLYSALRCIHCLDLSFTVGGLGCLAVVGVEGGGGMGYRNQLQCRNALCR